jgi:hypothetical protein
MISDQVERRVGIRNTQAFIDANPTTIIIKRPQIKATPAGGKMKTDPITLPRQRGRIVPMSGLVWDRSRTTADEGVVPDVSEMFVCLPGTDIRQDDYFACETSLGGWYEVVHVSPVEGYRKEARLRWARVEPKA